MANARKFSVLLDDTVILLKRYFDEERVRFDLNGYTLEDYLLLANRSRWTCRKSPSSLQLKGHNSRPRSTANTIGIPACHAAGIEADVHQSRHWHVTREVRDIYENAKSKAEIEQRLRGLVEYMKWRNEETLEVYQHDFNEQSDADTRDDSKRRIKRSSNIWKDARVESKGNTHCQRKRNNVRLQA